MQVKSKDQVICDKIYDLFKEVFQDDEEDFEEIKKIIFKSNKKKYVIKITYEDN